VTGLGKHDRLGIVLTAVALLGILVTLATIGALERRRVERDRADRAPASVGFLRSTLILLDLTDPLGPDDAQGLRVRLRNLVEFELAQGEVVSLYSVGQYVDSDVRRWFCRRYPGRDANALVETPRRIAARCDSLFTRPLDRELSAATASARSDRSDLAGSIREVTELQEFRPGIPHRRLILASDLLQNTPQLSFYRTPPPTSELPAAWLREHRADLRGVVVEVLQIPRAGVPAAERSALRTFWRQYFKECGASSVRFGRLP
jgi:hypothetical protein